MERILNYKVSENDAGKTIEVFLKEKAVPTLFWSS